VFPPHPGICHETIRTPQDFGPERLRLNFAMKGAATERHTGAFDTVPIDYGRVQQQLANVQQIRPLLWRDVAMFLASLKPS